MLNIKSTLLIAASVLGFMSTAHATETISCNADMYVFSDDFESKRIKVDAVIDEVHGSTLTFGDRPTRAIETISEVSVTEQQLDDLTKCDIGSADYKDCRIRALGETAFNFSMSAPLTALLLMNSYQTPLGPLSRPMPNKLVKFDVSKMARARVFNILPAAQAASGLTGLIEYYDVDGKLLGRLVQFIIEVSSCD